jgi:coenzyme F420-reducing hydrogenase beta subunit
VRKIIEINTDEGRESFDALVEAGEVEVISEYEPVERLTARVEKMKQAFTEFQNNRGSMRILNYYLRGRGISQSEIDTVINGLEEFFKQV